ncbi:hypothetical protein CC85DRAFT_288311 [Cutaneotrichosporon oleaginosum]|uniref:Uncharacterized protein n=1 Tax=Cutaneotrichosporon oleaginosum TaxID=879819 RepID=A0A0J0XF13_9TREE|nr:uncharacterized protein CC85DRAFT_288311 [Cutaneotrichosporon oleaginosum]KLT39667.1 hypothetical protein CC85DRAFT_288311 [Cutaneotrichosporon oleaginosum]TXT07026.1 hypothetical protein COLE_06357 [Cutaneotrichosporon oleaginosum]
MPGAAARFFEPSAHDTASLKIPRLILVQPRCTQPHSTAFTQDTSPKLHFFALWWTTVWVLLQRCLVDIQILTGVISRVCRGERLTQWGEVLESGSCRRCRQ